MNIDTTVHQLDEFEFQANSTYTLLSARKSGKSFLIRNLCYLLLKRQLIDVIYLISYTADVDKAYTSWIAPEYIINPKNMDKSIDLLFKVQKSLGDKAKKICIIFDDFDMTTQSNSIDVLYTRGRHYQITTILSAQITTKGVSTAIRNNTQYLFIRKLNSKTLKENVFNMLLNSEFDNGNDFYKFVKDHNEDYAFILYFCDDRPSNESLKLVKASEKKFKFEYTPTKKEKKDRL